MLRIRRTSLLALLAVIALVTSACGSSSERASTRAAEAAPVDRAAKIQRQLDRARQVELALSPVRGDATTRTVTSDGDELVVPSDPQRIVTLEPSLTDVVAALGFADRIVGTVEDPSTGGFHEHVASLLGPDVVNVGAEGDSNLEQVARADPDLILTWDWYPDQVPQLARIAPTVVVPYDHYDAEVGETLSNEQYNTWLVREIAALLGVDDRVDAIMTAFRAAVDNGRAALRSAVGDESVALLDVRVDEVLLSGYGYDGISALFYGDLGLTPDPLSETLPVWEELSLERVPELRAKHIVTFADGDEAQDRLDELMASSVWQRVPAVRDGRVVVVPPGLYYRGDDGPLGTALVIDDLVNRLAS
jgi:iron complex transport system substrate-binding protein